MRTLPFDYAVRNLGRSRPRLAIALLGSTLMSATVLVALSFVRGLDASMRASGGADNVIVLGAGSEESVERSEISAATPGLLLASVPGIRERGGTAWVSPEVHVMLPVGTGADDRAPGAAPRRQAIVRGATPAALLVHDEVALVEGRFPRPGRDELMAGGSLHVALGVPESAIAPGAQLAIEGRLWTIVGAFAAPGTVFDAEVWMPLADAMQTTRRETLSCVVVTLDPWDEGSGSGAELADVAAFAMMRPDLELAAIAERDYYGALSAFFAPVRAVVQGTALLVLLGGLLGGLNLAYASFAPRVREFAMLRALGFRRLALALSMIQESTLVTLAGALVAAGLGAWLLDGLAVRFSLGAFGLRVDAAVVAATLATGFLLGLAGALLPAVRCLSPGIPEGVRN